MDDAQEAVLVVGILVRVWCLQSSLLAVASKRMCIRVFLCSMADRNAFPATVASATPWRCRPINNRKRGRATRGQMGGTRPVCVGCALMDSCGQAYARCGEKERPRPLPIEHVLALESDPLIIVRLHFGLLSHLAVKRIASERRTE